MRLRTLVLCLVVLGAIAPLAAPTASACTTGGPSVCGTLRDVRCIAREDSADPIDCLDSLP